MPHELMRVTDSDDPRRCHGATRGEQCRNLAFEGSDYCLKCTRTNLTEVGRRQYLLTNPRYQQRMAELSTADDIKSLLDEVAIAKMLLEERLNLIKTDQDLYSASGAINTLLLTIEKLVSRAHILEQNLGQLYHRSTILQMMQAFVEIVGEEVRPLVGGVEALDRIIERIYAHAKTARNTEKARGMKLLKDDL